jgi:hypothetical protein
MGRPLKIQKSNTVDTGFTWVDTYNIGVVGGNTSLTGAQIKVRVKIGSNAEADGYIIRQKGATKYLVTDGTNTGVCALANLADSNLTADTMTVTIIRPDSGEVRLARLTNRYGLDFSDNRFALSFTDIADDTEIKSGTAQVTIDVAQVDNDETWG